MSTENYKYKTCEYCGALENVSYSSGVSFTQHVSCCTVIQKLTARVAELEAFKAKEDARRALIEETETEAPPGFDGG